MAEKEYIEREAALKANCYFCSAHLEDDSPCVEKCADYMKFIEIPAADVRPVVLCRDCKNYIERSGACAYLVVGMREDDFCSYGKKREES